MQGDSRFEDRIFEEKPNLVKIKDNKGATCNCYQMRLHGKLHFVKEIRPEYKNNPRMRAAFRKENELGYSQSHQSLPRYVYLEGIFSPEEYVITEWIEGQTLDEFLSQNPDFFSEKKNFYKFILELADVLDYLHYKDIVHGDVKPSNIMMTRDGKRPVLLDLGFAGTHSHDLTSGYSPGYYSEKYVFHEKGPEADYYSLGKVIEYIKEKSIGKIPSRGEKLAKILSDGRNPENLKSKDKIERFLNRKNKTLVITTVIIVLALVSYGIMGLINLDSENDRVMEVKPLPSIKEEPRETSPQMEEKVSGSVVNSILEEKVEFNDKNKPEKTAPVSKSEEVNLQQLEKQLKEEVNEKLNANYLPIIARIDSLLKEGSVSEEWLNIIDQQNVDAISKSINNFYYLDKYSDMDPSRVVDIVNLEYALYMKKHWYAKYKEFTDLYILWLQQEKSSSR